MDSILYLSSLSNLKRLEFRTEIPLIHGISNLGSMLVFPNLTFLDVGSGPLETITSLLGYIRLPAIETLYVEFLSGRISRRAIQAFWAAVREACPSNALTCFQLLHSIQKKQEEGGVPLDEDVLLYLTLEDLRPYTAFAELRELAVYLNCPVSLTDVDLLELASPRMERFVINSRWGWQIDEGGGITLSGLVQLLRQCLSLRELCLAIDTRTFTEIPKGLDVSFPAQRQLKINFVDSYILPEFIPGLVSVFSVLGLRHSMLEHSETGRWESGRDRFRLWNRVLDGLRGGS